MRYFLVFSLILFVSCQPHNKEKNQKDKLAGIGGLVIGFDQSQEIGLSNALVEVIGKNVSVTTDAGGRFVIMELEANQHYLLKASASGYAEAFRWIQTSSESMTAISFMLKVLPTPTMITMPQGVDAPVNVTDGISTLVIEPGDLVDNLGNVATGQVEVRLVSYDPVSEGQLLPAELVYADNVNNGYSLLVSSGMANIEIIQAGSKLQIATGKTLTWEFAYANELESRFTNKVPDLWAFNETTGIWENEGTANIDLQAGLLKGELPHLSLHNYDDCMAAAGCLQVLPAPNDNVSYIEIPATPTTITVAAGMSTNGLAIAEQVGGSSCWNIGCGLNTMMIGGTTSDKVPVTFSWNNGTAVESKIVNAPMLQCGGQGWSNPCWNNAPGGSGAAPTCGTLYYKVVPVDPPCGDVTKPCVPECCKGLICLESACVLIECLAEGDSCTIPGQQGEFICDDGVCLANS